MDRQALRAMQDTLRVDVARMNADAARRLMADTAEAEKARVIRQQTQRGGIAPTLAQVVDSKRGAAFDAVRPDGVILLEWGYVREVALALLNAIRDAGPKRSGDWAAELVILSDGVQVSDAKMIPHLAQEVKVVSTVPYARRLEIGKTRRGDPFILDDEDFRLVERTALRLRKVYAEVAKVSFGYVSLTNAHQLTNRNARRGRGGGEVRYPAALIQGWQVL